jgi:hypothetical protein
LKTENGDYNRRIEGISDELSVKEEQSRQLQWRLDDERNSKQQGDDQIQRRVHQLNLDLAVVREKAIKDNSDLQRALDKVRVVYNFNRVSISTGEKCFCRRHLLFPLFLLYRIINV